MILKSWKTTERSYSGFHCFIDWFKDARDSGCFSTFWLGWRKMEDALSPKTVLDDKKNLEKNSSVKNANMWLAFAENSKVFRLIRYEGK